MESGIIIILNDMKRVAVISAIVLSMGLHQQVRAQKYGNTVHLDEVQVAADRKLKDAGVEKSIIDSTVLHDNLSMSIADILSKNSTLFVKSYGRATEATAEFRGTSPSHTQVVWNGMKINSPMLGTVDFSMIPAYFIDQVTLLHGASSLTLTGGGLGGAVEMSTQENPQEGIHGQFVQGIGSFNTYDDFLKLTYRKERFSSSTRVVYSNSDNDFRYINYDKKVDVYDDLGNRTGSYHPEEINRSGYFDELHLLQEFGYELSPSDMLRLSVWYNNSLRGLPFLSVDYHDDSEFTNECSSSTLRAVMSWRHLAEQWNLTARSGYSDSDIDYDHYSTHGGVHNTITKSSSKTGTLYSQVTADWNITEKLLLTSGASAYYNHVKSSDQTPFHTGKNYDRARSEGDLDMQVRWRPVPLMTLSGILREEWHGKRFSDPIPALFAEYVVYEPLNMVLKASAARNYRHPSMDDLYFKPGGNPDLKPEKGYSFDAGIEIAVSRERSTLRANLTAFDSHISDWILWTPDTKGFWVPSNVKKVHNYGIETMLGGSFLVGKEVKLSASANYAWTPSKNMGEQVSSTDASYGKQLCYVPEHSANAVGRIAWRGWTLGYQWNYYSERFTTTSNEVNYITGRLIPYFMNDASLEKQFSIKKTCISVKGVVNNILGSEWQTVLSRPLPGRNYEIFVTIRY